MNTHSGRGTTAMEILLHKHLLVKFLTLISILGFHNQTLAFNKDHLLQIEDERSFAPQRTGEEAWSMVKKKGNQFVVNDHPFYFNGFNTYWLMIFGADESTKGNVTQLFQQASSVGLSVCRTWAFSDGKSPALQKSPSVYDEQIFKGLDFVVSEARKYKIRLILSLVNNWKDYGGKSQYVEWAKERGQQLTDEDAFYSNPVVKTYYKNHVKTVLTRVNTFTKVAYKDDPTIFAWELINEPRCPTDPSGNMFQSWIQEMASYVKSIDPNHLLEIGSEGYYGPSTAEKGSLNPNSYSTQVGTDFVRNHRTAEIDFASAHIYSDTWISTKISDAHITFYNSWMQAHISDAEKLKMPIVFAEFGLSSKDEGFTISFRDTIYKTAYNNQYVSATKGGAAGGSMMWQLFPSDSVNMDDGYAIVLSKSPSTSNIISHQSRYLRLINSKALNL